MTETLRSATDEKLHSSKYWWVFIITGVFWLIISLVLLRFDATSAVTVGLMAGIFALLAGVNEFVTAAWSKELRWFRLAFGVLFVVVGIVCLAYPDKSFEIIAAIFAWYFLFKGILDIIKSLDIHPVSDRLVVTAGRRPHRARTGIVGRRLLQGIGRSAGSLGGRRGHDKGHNRDR